MSNNIWVNLVLIVVAVIIGRLISDEMSARLSHTGRWIVIALLGIIAVLCVLYWGTHASTQPI